MNKATKLFNKRKARVHNAIRTNTKDGSKLRLSVFRSNKHIYAQLIDDSKGVTLAASSTDTAEFKNLPTSNIEAASKVGKAIALKAKEKNIQTLQVVFDKGAYKYHGRVKALAEAARENGLEF